MVQIGNLVTSEKLIAQDKDNVIINFYGQIIANKLPLIKELVFTFSLHDLEPNTYLVLLEIKDKNDTEIFKSPLNDLEIDEKYIQINHGDACYSVIIEDLKFDHEGIYDAQISVLNKNDETDLVQFTSQFTVRTEEGEDNNE